MQCLKSNRVSGTYRDLSLQNEGCDKKGALCSGAFPYPTISCATNFLWQIPPAWCQEYHFLIDCTSQIQVIPLHSLKSTLTFSRCCLKNLVPYDQGWSYILEVPFAIQDFLKMRHAEFLYVQRCAKISQQSSAILEPGNQIDRCHSRWILLQLKPLQRLWREELSWTQKCFTWWGHTSPGSEKLKAASCNWWWISGCSLLKWNLGN